MPAIEEPILPPALRARPVVAPPLPNGTPTNGRAGAGPVPSRNGGAGPATTVRRIRVQSGRGTERGLAAWQALGVLVAVAAGAGLIDLARGPGAQGVFNVGLIIASFVAIVLVRHRSMFTIVVAPPIIFMLGKVAASTLRHQDIMSRSGRLDIMTNWFVYGFPAIAAATAVVALVAGLRLITGK